MLGYFNVSFFLGLNLILYAIVHIPLDYKTYSVKTSSRIREENHPWWKNNVMMILILLPSVYFWTMFIIIPITGVVNFELFYTLPILPIGSLDIIIQLIGLGMISCATVIACWGRISRGRRASSWGIPLKLETQGMFRYIRHPLYASYCYYFVGFLLLFQSFFMIPLLAGIIGYYQISKYEENILVTHFGEEFINYQRRTGRFFPFLMKRKGE